MDPEEPGLLGNLPRSRPGTRSDKRGATTGSKPAPKRSQAAKPGVKSTAAGGQAARKPAAKPAGAQAVRSEARWNPRSRWPAPACAWPKGVTREVLRRLPRP